jgi:magnesium transporter
MPMKRRSRPRTSRRLKAGSSPGTPIFIGEQRLDQVQITALSFGEQAFEEHGVVTLAELARCRQPGRVNWINVNGLHDAQAIEAIGGQFGLHPLTIEDILNTNQRPKVEEYDRLLYLVLRMVTPTTSPGEIETEQLSLILGEDFVLSFQERDSGVLESVRTRLRNGRGKIRQRGPDYLAYALMDAVIDQYFVTLEQLGEFIEELEDTVTTAPVRGHIAEIHRLKRNMLTLRRATWPLREELARLEKDDSGLVADGTRIYLRDLYDHTIQIIDSIETNRDILSGMHDIYLSGISNRMTEIMKVLTVIATIFIPLTFVAGIYGMNFEHMPELAWRWGYFAALGFMGALAAGMLAWFRVRRWI